MYKHSLKSYTSAYNFMNEIDAQLEEHLLIKMENDFENSLEDNEDHKSRAKRVKKFNRDIKELRPLTEVIYPLQVRYMQIRTNLTFLLECAHNRVSYVALAKYFAEYDFLTQVIKKECNKYKNNENVLAFLDSSEVLTKNYFDILLDTIEQMRDNIRYRMNKYPEQYLDLDIEKDSEVVFDVIKETYKNQIKKLKEDRKKALEAAKNK